MKTAKFAAHAAHAVHVLTASGIAFLFLAAVEIAAADTRAWLVFVYFLGATFTDAIDGPLARRADVKRNAASVDGRTIDDLVDYIGFTFLPLLLIYDQGWLPNDVVAAAVLIPAAIASLLGFAHTHAKDEAAGFFRGFPSYWNIIALYAGLAASLLGPAGQWLNAAVVLGLAVMTVSPVWLLYPNLAPRPWKTPVRLGSYAWALLVIGMLPFFPDDVPGWVVLASLIYPAFYLYASLHLRHRWPGHAQGEGSHESQPGVQKSGTS